MSPQKGSICLLCIFCMVSTWIQRINTENGNQEKPLERWRRVQRAARRSLVNGTRTARLGLAQFIDRCKKSAAASGSLSSDNRLHSHGPFIVRGSRWQMDGISVSRPLNLFSPPFFSSSPDTFWGLEVSRGKFVLPVLLLVSRERWSVYSHRSQSGVIQTAKKKTRWTTLKTKLWVILTSVET